MDFGYFYDKNLAVHGLYYHMLCLTNNWIPIHDTNVLMASLLFKQFNVSLFPICSYVAT